MSKNKIMHISFTLGCLALGVGTTGFAEPHNVSLSEELGWISTPYSNTLCKGYYQQPQLSAFQQPILPFEQATTQILSPQGVISNQSVTILHGPVTVIQSGRRLEADKAIITRDPQTGKIINIDLYGHVKFYTNGRLLIGEYAHLKLQDHSGYIKDAHYRFLLEQDSQIFKYLSNIPGNKQNIGGLSAWGAAKQIILTPKHATFLSPTYSTCPPNTHQWQLKASTIHIDQQNDIGHAKNVHLDVKGIPLFYWPYLNFPTSKERKTGFLFPLVGYTNRSGAEFAWPFYLNLAPNYDAIFAPTLYSKRGVLVKGHFRYLFSHNLGQVDFGVLPHDHEFHHYKETARLDYPNSPSLPDLENSSNTRGYIHWLDQAKWNQHWSSNIDYTKVSDDYYFDDFGGVPEIISSNQLLRQANINYQDPHWHFTGALENYLTLHQVDRQAVSNLYSRYPDLRLSSHYLLGSDIYFSSNNQLVYFTRQLNPGELLQPVDGSRFIIDPSIEIPKFKPYGYFIPKVDFQGTNYALQNQLPGLPSSENRAIPRINIDTGLYFNKNTELFQKDYLQILQPRLFYLYVPYHDQSFLPIFDSGIVPFTFDQLFQNNRFSGYDRIGDANQVTLALTDRWIDENTGDEKLFLGVGKIDYFHTRKVQLCSTPDCQDNALNYPGALPSQEHFSPYAFMAKYDINPLWSFSADWTFDSAYWKTNTADGYFQYKPNDRFLLNLGYNFLLNGNYTQQISGIEPRNLNQVSGSIVTPLTLHWSGMGLLNYNINENHPQTYLLGLQYDSCCWRIRFAGGRTFTAIDEMGRSQFNDAFYVQIELKGLASLDPENLSPLLENQIPGFNDPFPKSGSFLTRN